MAMLNNQMVTVEDGEIVAADTSPLADLLADLGHSNLRCWP